MRILFLPVRPGLAAWIHSHWLFDSPAGIPQEDRRLVVPNGRTKLVVTLEGPLILEDGPVRTEFPQGRVLLIGPWDRPVAIASAAGRTRTLGLEFTPDGAQRFFDLPLAEIRNRVVDWEQLGTPAAILARRISEAPEPATASQDLQSTLATWAEEKRSSNLVVEFAVREFQRRSGLVGMEELARSTGYTRRTLDTLFQRHVGLSPKTLATIIRFQQVYRRWAQEGWSNHPLPMDQDLYFDQSHLIREFRRYTGYSPGRFSPRTNQFGRLFYSHHAGPSHLSNS